MKEKKQKAGPKPERLKLEGDWRDLMKKALKKRPKKGDQKKND